MRTDETLARKSFRFSDAWKTDATTGKVAPAIDQRLQGTDVTEDGRLVVHSLSGNERNHLFLNRAGKTFHDVSLLSGADSLADGRGWALIDYDRDGYQDIALVNANEPLFQLFHNNIGQLESSQNNHVVALRFIGGNTTSKPTTGLSNRDGYGAIVTAEIGDKTIVREHRCGEGFASQNSATMLLGIGTAEKIDHLSVRWPSGRFYVAEDVPAGKLLTLREDFEGPSPDETYHLDLPARTAPDTTLTKFPIADPDATPARIRLYTTTATWCPACLAHLPVQRHLRQSLPATDLELVALPIDPEDTPEKLAAYAETHQPPYRQLTATDPATTLDFLKTTLSTPDPPLPSTIVTDTDGNVLDTLPGLPTLSQLRKLLSQ